MNIINKIKRLFSKKKKKTKPNTDFIFHWQNFNESKYFDRANYIQRIF